MEARGKRGLLCVVLCACMLLVVGCAKSPSPSEPNENVQSSSASSSFNSKSDSSSSGTEAQMPKVGEPLQSIGGAYFWDANGDGDLEHMWIDFNDNGDEAPSGYSIRVFDDKIDVSEYLDNAYVIEDIVLEQDTNGYYVVLVHDGAKCEIRLVGEELVLKPV